MERNSRPRRLAAISVPTPEARGGARLPFVRAAAAAVAAYVVGINLTSPKFAFYGALSVAAYTWQYEHMRVPAIGKKIPRANKYATPQQL